MWLSSSELRVWGSLWGAHILLSFQLLNPEMWLCGLPNQQGQATPLGRLVPGPAQPHLSLLRGHPQLPPPPMVFTLRVFLLGFLMRKCFGKG